MRSLASHSVKGSAAAIALLLAPELAAAQGPAVYREVRLDMSGLPTGAVEVRRALGACLAQNLPVAFAGRISPGARGAPVLVVRPTSIWLAPPPTGGDSEFGGGSGNLDASSPDSMAGEAIIGGTRVPLTVMAGGGTPSLAAPLQQAYNRTTQLCQSFAYWLARKI
jgi:hypothetical protein